MDLDYFCFAVGENTYPNFVPLSMSLTEQELIQVCHPDNWVALDECPFIYKQFAQHNYLTAFLEDSPRIATFNYLKTGFVRPPADKYIRPFMIAAYKNGGEDLVSV